MLDLMQLRSSDGRDEIALANVASANGDRFTFVADLRVRTTSCTLDDQIFFDAYGCDEVAALLERIAIRKDGEAQLRHEHSRRDHLYLRSFSNGRAQAGGELSIIGGQGWHSFELTTDTGQLEAFLRSLQAAVAQAG